MLSQRIVDFEQAISALEQNPTDPELQAKINGKSILLATSAIPILRSYSGMAIEMQRTAVLGCGGLRACKVALF